MKIEMINNPRKADGCFGDICCDLCGCYSGAYIELNAVVVCKGCLLGWVELINETILQDAVRRARLKGD